MRMIGAVISSQVMDHNGMTQMAMGTVTTGVIQTGILLVILIGLVNLFPMLWSQISVQIHRLQMLTMKDVRRVRRILMVMVSTTCSIIVLRMLKGSTDMKTAVHCLNKQDQMMKQPCSVCPL